MMLLSLGLVIVSCSYSKGWLAGSCSSTFGTETDLMVFGSVISIFSELGMGLSV